ncbi:radical SAM family heme chaperone HemW [Patulibacter defluvii]|uniref:radical SAM family heme chaperone HemW n=1 Tax=Patulibacter defluvii TaxID=3095358 RepID=UPI002A75C3BB|nr:radical SAM family heme chaperone HemW [Patulibacter sp. DM4]
MSPRLPDGDPAPDDGALPATALAERRGRPLSVYVHVPWCASRCGYCDFNTYVPPEGALEGLGERFAAAVDAELALAARVLDERPPVATVFLGGGTPSLLDPAVLGRVVAAVDRRLGLAPGAEVTCECNPESVDGERLARLRAAGVTRVSFGMQSARAHVLRSLERAHDPARPPAAVAEARAAGFDAVGLDLIYGADGERDEDWGASLRTAIAAGPDSISAYALTVEPGTRYAALVARGARRGTDDGTLGRRYEAADRALAAAGYRWYELSNWARNPAGVCRHNLAYWRGDDWWGVGPGAHSHVAGVRWWNALRPASWMARLAEGRSPAVGRETLDRAARELEALMTAIRLPEGLTAAALPAGAAARVPGLLADGVVDPAAWAAGRVALTRRGRPLADGVLRRLVA